MQFARDHGAPPKSVVVIMARLASSSDRGNYAYPTIWATGTSDFQVRFARSDGSGWSGRNGYAFYWAAFWQ